MASSRSEPTIRGWSREAPALGPQYEHRTDLKDCRHTQGNFLPLYGNSGRLRELQVAVLRLTRAAAVRIVKGVSIPRILRSFL